jgi:hypothetical protein
MNPTKYSPYDYKDKVKERITGLQEVLTQNIDALIAENKKAIMDARILSDRAEGILSIMKIQEKLLRRPIYYFKNDGG